MFAFPIRTGLGIAGLLVSLTAQVGFAPGGGRERLPISVLGQATEVVGAQAGESEQPGGSAIVADCGGVQILSTELAVDEAEDYCEYALREREKVDGFWGPTWAERIRIHVASSYVISSALIPAFRGDRGFMAMPLHLVRTRRSATLHETVHIYAPSAKRFLAEGLAVYLQARLGGNPAFPNFGRPLRFAASATSREAYPLERLDEVRTPSPLRLTPQPPGQAGDDPLTYSVAGSFVGYLIESYGLDLYRRVHESGDYESTYGKPLTALEDEWRDHLKEINRI